jgi:hypothetical protein
MEVEAMVVVMKALVTADARVVAQEVALAAAAAVVRVAVATAVAVLEVVARVAAQEVEAMAVVGLEAVGSVAARRPRMSRRRDSQSCQSLMRPHSCTRRQRTRKTLGLPHLHQVQSF